MLSRALVAVAEADGVADLVLEDARDVRRRPEALERGVVVEDDEAVREGLKVVPLTACVDDEAQPPPMARTPTGSSSSGSPNVNRPTPRLPAVQYGSSPGMFWIGTSRVPPKASAMDAVGGSVHATRAVRSWSSVSAPWIGEGASVLRYQVIA